MPLTNNENLWEHKVATPTSGTWFTQTQLNTLSVQGWELVAVCLQSGGTGAKQMAFFKRMRAMEKR
jgi:S-adenosylmethionine:tRNA-ribosyltransferase-isomerase (queuine synthetase)